MKLRAKTGAPILLNQVDYAAEDARRASQLARHEATRCCRDRSAPRIATIPCARGNSRPACCTRRVIPKVASSLYFPAEKMLDAGDTLFARSIGRTDLPGGLFERIIRSLHDRVLTLPDETTVIPGHGPATTIGEEREENPFLK